MSESHPYAIHAKAMTLLPRDGVDYSGEAAIWRAYHGNEDFRIVHGPGQGGLINRSDIVRYTPVQTVTVLYAQQTKAYTFDARRPHH